MGIQVTGGVKVPQGKFKVYVTPPPPPPPAGNELWAWGHGNYTGHGDTVQRSSPVQVGALVDWSSAYAASDTGWSVSLKTDYTIWVWGGDDGFGRLGLGDTANRSSPVQIGALTNWAKINPGYWHANAIKSDGSLWTWGRGNVGRLGIGDLANRSSPVQVGALTNWSVTNAGQDHTIAIKTNGELWAWGSSTYGRLGNETASGNKSSPVQIGALTNWASISAGNQHSLAIKTDGSLWTWGRNTTYGNLGLGDVANRSSPVQVGALTDWSSISAGGNHSLAIKTDGSLWVWGGGLSGRLGLGDNAHRSSPVQVGALTDWATADGSANQSVALKTDGTIWSWGDGTFGRLGHGNTTDYNSPVQIGSTTTWTSIEASANHTVATKL